MMRFVQARSLRFEVPFGAFLIARSVVKHNGLECPRCGLRGAGSTSGAVELCICSQMEIPRLISGWLPTSASGWASAAWHPARCHL